MSLLLTIIIFPFTNVSAAATIKVKIFVYFIPSGVLKNTQGIPLQFHLNPILQNLLCRK